MLRELQPYHSVAIEARLFVLPFGFIYAASAVTGVQTKRNAGVLLVSLDDVPVQVRLASTDRYAGTILQGRVIALAPGVSRSLQVGPSGALSIHYDPTHPIFLALATGLDAEGGRVLSESWLNGLGQELRHCRGNADAATVAHVFEQSALAITSECPQTIVRDQRIVALLQELQNVSPIDYSHRDVLTSLQLSASRASHLFTENAGLSLRSFLLWRKIKEAIIMFETGVSMTEIAHASGFTDSAHFCRTFISCLGLRPSMFGPDRAVKVSVLAAHTNHRSNTQAYCCG